MRAARGTQRVGLATPLTPAHAAHGAFRNANAAFCIPPGMQPTPLGRLAGTADRAVRNVAATAAPSPHRHVWASAADGSFAVHEDTENEDLGRGTLIKIHLKDEAQVRVARAQAWVWAGRASGRARGWARPRTLHCVLACTCPTRACARRGAGGLSRG